MDAIERIEKATALCAGALSGVTPDDMSKPTPCSEFDVKALLNHIIGGMDMLHTAATGGKAVPPEGNIVGPDPAAQYATSRERLLGVLREPGVLEKTWEMPFGAMPGKMMAAIAFMENVTHAWDVKKATGQDTELDADLVQEVHDVVSPMDAMLRMPGVCGPAVPVGDDASPTAKLMAFLGRQP